MAGIFLSYRRHDSHHIVGRMFDWLTPQFGESSIFLDVNAIPAGSDFSDFLQQKLRLCNVVLVIIGENWVSSVDENNQRRLDDPRDYVRLEIELALTLGVLVVPILVDDTLMPSEYALPTSIRGLALRNAVRVRSGLDFRRDMERLISVIQEEFSRDFFLGVKVGHEVAQSYLEADSGLSSEERQQTERLIPEGDTCDYYQGLLSGLHTAAGIFS